MNRLAAKSIVILFLLSSHLIMAQETMVLKGMVIDATSSEALVAANISVPNSSIGTISDLNGKYTLVIPKKVKSIVVSYIGYESQKITTSSLLKNAVISLKRSEEYLDLITIVSKPSVEPLTEKYESVLDFSVQENRILMLAKERINGYILKLTDFEGKVLHRLDLNHVKLIEKLSTSCMDTHFLISEFFAYQISLEDDRISLIHKDKRKAYDQYIANCIDSNSQYFYMSKKSKADQISEISGFHRHQEKVVNFGRIQDDLNAKNYKEEKHYLDFMNNKGEDEWIHLTTTQELDDFYNYWEKAALLAYNFYLPVNYHLHAQENSVFILDHEKHLLNKFALNGKLIYRKPLQYSKDRNWSEKIYKDLKTEKLYTYMHYRSGKLLMEIDLSTGQVKPVMKFELSFIEDFKIYDETIYFTSSGLVAGQEARILRKMRI